MRRVVEEGFPVRQVSLDAVHEKNVRHGHVSTTHIWACPAAVGGEPGGVAGDAVAGSGQPEEALGGAGARRVVRIPYSSRDRTPEETRGGVLNWGRVEETIVLGSTVPVRRISQGGSRLNRRRRSTADCQHGIPSRSPELVVSVCQSCTISASTVSDRRRSPYIRSNCIGAFRSEKLGYCLSSMLPLIVALRAGGEGCSERAGSGHHGDPEPPHLGRDTSGSVGNDLINLRRRRSITFGGIT